MFFHNLVRLTHSGVYSRSRSTYRKIKQFNDIYLRPVGHKVHELYNSNIQPGVNRVCQYCNINLRPPLHRIIQLSMNTYNEVHNNLIAPLYNSLTYSTELILACKNGQSDVAMQLIEAGADVNTKDIHGCTPLIYACSNSLSDVAIELIDRGANIHLTYSSSRTTALIMACKRGLTDVCELLIDNGADINAVDSNGYTPLLFASMHDNSFYEVFELLVDLGADINATASDKSYPLWYSCINNNVRACTLLLDKGSKLDNMRLGLNPLWHSCLYGNWDITRLLVEHGADVNMKLFGISPLVPVCVWGNEDIIQLLIAHGADIHDTGLGSNVLHWACTNPDNFDIVRMFIDQGVDVKKHASFDITPLLVSCFFLDNDMSCLLIDRGADVNDKTSFGITPLLFACRSSVMNRCVVKLINNGADINTESLFGTPLTIACENGFSSAAVRLINLGADIDARGFDNEPPIVKAIKSELDDSTVLSLIKRGASIDELLDDESILLYDKQDDSDVIENSASACAIMGYFKINSLRLASCVDIANNSADTFVSASKMFSNLWNVLDKTKKRIHNDVFVTKDFVCQINYYQDLVALQLVRLINISKHKKISRDNARVNDSLNVINRVRIGKIKYQLTIR